MFDGGGSYLVFVVADGFGLDSVAGRFSCVGVWCVFCGSE